MQTLTRSQKYISEFVYGAIDGTVTTFAIISGVVGAGLSPAIILILGISNVLADGWSMASSNYLSERAEAATTGNSNDEKSPVQSAFVTFISFVTVGFIPILPFVIALFSPFFSTYGWVLSIAFTGVAFIIIGSARGNISGENKFRASLETLMVGTLAALIAYSVGFLLKGIV